MGGKRQLVRHPEVSLALMNLRLVLEALRRRWWIAVPILLLTAAGVLWITSDSNAEYEATAILLLAGPQVSGSDTTTETATEQAVEGDPGAILDRSAVIEIVVGDETRSTLTPNAELVDYTVTEVGGGVLRVEATSQSAEAVVDTANTVITEVGRVVQELDAADDSRTAEIRPLAEARVPRQREVVDEEGVAETVYFARASVQLEIVPAGSALQSPYTATAGTLRIIEEAASSPAVIEAIRAEVGDPRAQFELVYQLRDAAPIVHVVARASSREATMDTLQEVLTYLDEDLAERQALTGAGESTWVEFERLTMPESASVPAGRLRRPIVTVIALGIVAAASLAVLVDTLMGRGTPLRLTRQDGAHVETESAKETRRSRSS